MTMTLTTGGVAVELEGPDDVLEAIAGETAPFFERVAAQAAPALRLAIRLAALDGERRAALDGPSSTVAVDTSLYRHLASSGTRWELAGGWAVRIDATGTVCWFRAGEGATLWQPDRALAIRDAVRLVKSILTVAAERAGAVQLHSSAVVAPDGAVLLIGDMWQGKTTLLLELLAEFDVDQLSCDTVVVRADDTGTRVWGWPSPFSLSHGTLVDHAELAPLLPPERDGVPYDTLWREAKKAVLTSSEVVERFGASLVPRADRIAACILIQFAPEAHTRIERVASADELRAALRQMYLGSRDPIYHNWHRWLTADDALLDGNVARVAQRLFETVEIHRMVWAPGPRSLLKRVPALARAHEVLRAHRLVPG